VSDAILPQVSPPALPVPAAATAPALIPAQAARGVATGPSPLAWLAVIAAVIGLGYLLHGLVIPIALAALLAYFLNPLVVWIQGFGVRRTVSVTALFTAFALLVVLLATVVAPRFRAEIVALWSNLPGLAHTLEVGIDGAPFALRDVIAIAARGTRARSLAELRPHRSSCQP